MSAALAQSGEIFWSKGFCYADVEDSISASSATVYPLASPTKTFAASRFRYRGYLYGLLGRVMEQATTKPFRQLVVENIIQPLGLKSTAPNIRGNDSVSYGSIDTALIAAQLAKVYTHDPTGAAVPAVYEPFFGTAAGLMTSARDLANFGAAILNDKLIPPRLREQMFNPKSCYRNLIIKAPLLNLPSPWKQSMVLNFIT